MAIVKRKEGEDLESMLRRFRRKVNDEAIISDMKKHEAFKSESEEKREHMNAVKRKAFRQKRKYEENARRYRARKNRNYAKKEESAQPAAQQQ